MSDSPKSLWQRLKTGLSRSRQTLQQGITDVFTKKRLDQETLDALYDTLIMADMGVVTSKRLIDRLAGEKMDKEITSAQVKEALANAIEEMLTPYEIPITPGQGALQIYLAVGINGSGKTTTLAKLGSLFKQQGKKVAFVAGDTFRAAAKEQLQFWADREGILCYTALDQADPAGLVFDAIKCAKAACVDILLIDTAGRLHNKKGLMEELNKIIRVIQKAHPQTETQDQAPHGVLMVLDATLGQNTLQHVEIFKESAHVTGLIMTKLDGTAKGGILLNLTQTYHLPIHFIGVGESVSDLQPFQAKSFAQNLVGEG